MTVIMLMTTMMTRMTKKRVFDAGRCLQNEGPDKRVFDDGVDDDSDGVRNDEDDNYNDYDHDDQDDEEDGV